MGKKTKVCDPVTGEILGTMEPERPDKQNRDFVMMYRKFIERIADLGMNDAQALRVLLFLARHMDGRNALVVPMSLIADMLKITRQTVSSKIKYLETNGWICVFKTGRQNVYVVNPDVIWTSYDYQKSYCKFDAKVMLDCKDNWNIISNNDKMNLRHIDMNVLKQMAEKEFPDLTEDKA